MAKSKYQKPGYHLKNQIATPILKSKPKNPVKSIKQALKMKKVKYENAGKMPGRKLVKVKRKGYKRRQRYGPSNMFTKEIHIKPYYVWIWKTCENYDFGF